MPSEALLRIKIITDSTQAALGLDKTAKSTSKFGSAMQKAALPAAAVGLALVAFGKHALDSASSLQQAQGAVESVFGKQAGAVERLSKRSADSMGLAQSAYLQYAAVVGSALQNAGFTSAQAVEESNKVMQRGADMAATFGGTTADAVEAINAAVARGEFDPLEKYGVSLNMTAVNAELAARGQDDLTGSALKHAKAQVILDSVYKNTAKSAGQFAREQDTAAGSAAIASANFEDASAALGQALLPAAASVAKVLASIAKWMQKNSTLTLIFAGAIGALVTAILLYNAAMKIAAIVQTAFNVALSANVIFLVIVAVIALVAVFVIAYKKVGWFRKAVDATWAAIKQGVKVAAQVFRAVWNAAVTVVKAYFRAYLVVGKAVFNAIRTIVRATADAMKTAFRAVKDVVVNVFGSIRDFIRNAIGAAKDAIRNAMDTAKNIIRAVRDVLSNLVPPGLGAALAAPFNAAKSAINSVVSAIKSLIGWVSNLISKIAGIHWPSPPKGLTSILGKINPFGASGGGGAAGPTPRTYYAPTGGVAARGLAAPAGVVSGGAGVTINIFGALDPEAVARQVQRLLADHNRRVGRPAVNPEAAA